MDFFNSERAKQIRESIRYWHMVMADTERKKRSVAEETDSYLESARLKQEEFEKNRSSRPIPEGVSERAAQMMREMNQSSTDISRKIYEDAVSIIRGHRDGILAILDEEIRLGQVILAEELNQLNLAFDVAEINMEQNLSNAIKFLMDAGYPQDEATAIATKIHEEAVNKRK